MKPALQETEGFPLPCWAGRMRSIAAAAARGGQSARVCVDCRRGEDEVSLRETLAQVRSSPSPSSPSFAFGTLPLSFESRSGGEIHQIIGVSSVWPASSFSFRLGALRQKRDWKCYHYQGRQAGTVVFARSREGCDCDAIM